MISERRCRLVLLAIASFRTTSEASSLKQSWKLGPTWRCCPGDWLGWDFEHQDGTRLEVKQSAARQTWAPPKRSSRPTFDIRTRSGFYLGSEWHPEVGRHAHLYVSPIIPWRIPLPITLTPGNG